MQNNEHDTDLSTLSAEQHTHYNDICKSKHERYDVLLLPNLTLFFDFRTLCHFRLISRACNNCAANDEVKHTINYWRNMCLAYALYKGLFTPLLINDQNFYCRKYFFDELLKLKDKWRSSASGHEMDTQASYQIKVDSRFKPGIKGDERLTLPLHQFLKVKRRQKAEKEKLQLDTATVDGNNKLFVGENDPPEFLDPILGTLMRHPILLPSSGRVVDRSVAVQCILRGSRDPFDDSKLTTDMLAPQPELATRIDEWREKRKHVDPSFQVNEVKCLIDEYTLDPSLLDALMELQRISQASCKARTDDRIDPAAKLAAAEYELAQNDVGGEPEWNDDTTIQNEDTTQEQITDTTANATEPGVAVLSNFLPDSELNGAHDISGYSALKKGETARIIEVKAQTGVVAMHVPGQGVRPFYFSHVFDNQATQQQVYDASGMDAVAAVLNGFNACLLCYGQTGSGKTYTFFGPEGSLEGMLHGFESDRSSSTNAQDVHTFSPDTATFVKTDESVSLDMQLPKSAGIVLRAGVDLMTARRVMSKRGVTLSFTAQFIEIYEEQVIDLLTGNTVTVRRDNGEVVGAREEPMNDMTQMLDVLKQGHARKRFAATAMNNRSSRSHTAFVVHVLQKLDAASLAVSAACADELRTSQSGDCILRSTLHLVDLAGSERVKKSLVTGHTFREAVGINSSLFVLAKVISALVQGRSHVPYYESKLTTLLKAAFGGNSRTIAVINCRSDDEHGDETLESMRFGERCGMITNAIKQAATSYDTAIKTISSALTVVEGQLKSLESRGKQHLPSYKTLLGSYSELKRRRGELVAVGSPH